MPNRANQIVKLPFSDFSPDLDSLTKGSVRDMLGFYPTEKGFRTLPGLASFLNPLTGRIVGSYADNEAQIIIAGQFGRLFMSNALGPFVAQPLAFTNTTGRWRFDVYGSSKQIIGVNGTDAPVVSTAGAPFAVLGGGPPIFSIIQATDSAIVGVVPNSNEWWSTLVDTDWTPDITTETIQAFITNTPGNILAAVQLRGGICFFKERALHYGFFVGPPFFWNLYIVSHQVGAPCQEAVVPVRDVLYFWGPDDFYTFDGYSLNPIQNNLREFIFRDLDLNFKGNIAGYYDENNGPIVKWHYPSVNADPPGSLDSYVCLNIRFGTWGFGREQIDFPLYGMVNKGSGAECGVFDTGHSLKLYDPAASVGAPYITTNDIGDGYYLYSVNRARPRFSVYPPTGDIELQQFYQYVAGRPISDAGPIPPGPGGPLAPGAMTPGEIVSIQQVDGWFNPVWTERMQRFRLTVHDTCEIVELALDVTQSGEV